MFACVCNAIRESEVRGAREAGCRSPEEVMSFLGAQLQCRACVVDIVKTLDAREAAHEKVVAQLKAS
ncbi:MAG TPA: (2Fe-2S)-binding protein [Holophagaceae bacterium]|nr:(2Fe-2S)-binding protein [Holophagaceae bacterium]